MQQQQQTTDLNSYLEVLERARGNRRAALNNFNAADAEYHRAFEPMGGEADERAIRAILATCPTDSGYPRSHILVCLCLLYYAPEAMLGGKIPLALSKQIAAVLEIRHPSVYIARNKIVSWLRIYPDFRKLIRGLFAELPAVTATP